MKRTLLLVLATALTAGPALAQVTVTGEVFLSHKVILQNTELTAATTPKTEGTDLDRFRISVANKFNDQWSFRGTFEGRADGTNVLRIPLASFIGTGILMDKDTLTIGIQVPNAFNLDSMGNRWITAPFIDDEGFLINSLPSGLSYKMVFNALSVTLSSLSAESGTNLDSNDNIKMTGALIDYKINDAFLVWVSGTGVNGVETVGTNAGVALSGTKSTVVTTAGLNYKSEMVDAAFTYASAAYTVETGTAPKNNLGMGLNGTFKKLGGSSTNLYVDYRFGYDSYADTLEDTQSKMMIGPTWGLADGKMNLGVFYQMETFQGDYKTAFPLAKDPSNLFVKLAAKF